MKTELSQKANIAKSTSAPALRGFWKRLGDPHPSILSLEHRRCARLVSYLLVVTFLATFLAALLDRLLEWTEDMRPVLLINAVVYAFAYGLSRTKHFRYALGLTLASIGLSILYGAVVNQSPPALYFLVLVPLFSGLFLAPPLTLLTAAGCIAIILYLAAVSPWLTVVDAFTTSFLIGLTGVVARVAAVVQLQDSRQIEQQSRELSATVQELTEGRAALKRSEIRLVNILDNAAEAILVTNSDQEIIHFNKSAEEIFGYRSDEIIGLSLDVLLPQRFATAHHELVDRFGRSTNGYRPGTVRSDVIGKRKDGSEFPAQAGISKYVEDGRLIYTAVLNDLSLRIQTEQALRESEEKYRTLFNRIPAALYRTSSDGWILSANPALIDLLGYPDFESLAKVNVNDMYVDSEARVRDSEILARDEVVLDSQFRVRCFDGRIIWVSDNCQVVYDEEGRVVFHEGSLEDITERILAETALKASEDRYRLLADSTPDFIFSLDREGRLAAVNESISRGSGLSTDALVGKGLEVFGLPQADIEQLQAVSEHVFASGKVIHTEMTTPLANGDILTLDLVLRPIRDPAGEITGIHGVCRDVTGIRNTEQELRKVNRALKVLSECNQAVLRAEEEPALLDEVSRIIVEAGEYKFAWVGYTDEEDERATIRPAVSAGFGAANLEWVADGGLDREEDLEPARRAVETGEPAVVQDIRAGSGCASWRAAAVREGFRAAIGLPLLKNGRAFGVLVLYAGETDAFDAGEVHLLQDLASDLAYGIQALRLRAQHERAEARVHRQLRSLAALRDIDLAITSSQDLRVIFDVLLGKVVAELRIDAACVLLMRPHTQSLEYTAGRGFRTHALQHSHLRLGDGYAGKAALERQMIRIPDLRSCDSKFIRSPDFSAEGFVAYYAVPLIAKGQVKGVMEVFQRDRHDPDREWLDFLETLAGQAAIALDNADLFSELQASNAELTLAYDTTIEGWSRALDLRDRETEGHTRRVMGITLRLARKMGIGDAELVHIRRGALLHDIGKMGIPDSILLKPGKLTDEEWDIMRNHPVYAYEMLSPIDYLKPALEIPYCHHEKWDGSGYPRGLKGEQIPLAARIFAVADVWDALRSDRPYRKAWTNEKALEYIRTQAGSHFDPAVVAVFIEEGLDEWQPG